MEQASETPPPLRIEPGWPHVDGCRPVFLLDASSALEERLLRAWIERRRPPDLAVSEYDVVRLPPSRRPRKLRSLHALEACLASGGAALLAPLRVAWLPKKRDGLRSVLPRDLILLRDPRDPGALHQRLILRREPDRCRIVAGEPATVSELRERWQRAGGADLSQTTSLAEFVARQAVLALERAERMLRGARYKVPRLVHEDILGRPSFRGGLHRLAGSLGRTHASVTREASRDLREIAATHSPLVIDLVAWLIRLLYTQGYGRQLYYDRDQLKDVKALAQQNPVVFLPSHKSNLDHLVLQYALHENGHAPNHTAGGINMNFFPVGPLVRRSGTFFIRRSFRDDEIYKFVLHHYIDYLIEKRFSLEWYIEGGRSRAGKLLPPRFGLLAYVVDSYRRAKSDDVFLIPVSIAYDQISDVGDYAAEQRGGAKARESFGWFLGVVRRLRRRYGNIHIRFGEPLSLAKTLGRPVPDAAPSADEKNLGLQKLAFEVAVRINRVTPITSVSLVTLALLGTGDRALTVGEVRVALANVLHFTRRRNLPTVGELDLDGDEGVRRALEALERNGVVSCFKGGAEPVYQIGPDQQLQAAYYRNTVIHFFVNPAIAELALLRAAEPDVVDPTEQFWDEAMRLRDLFKFEFFFAEKEIFRGEVQREVAMSDVDWERKLGAGGEAILQLLRRFKPFSAHRVLRPFVEAYQIVGDHLERRDPGLAFEEAAFTAECLGLGRQYHLQRRVHSAASVSQVLIQTAIRLARNRALLDPGPPDLAERRRAFAEEIRSAVRRVGAIDALAASRRAGLID
ncbi:MAG TPA: glycerol-3-phosphate 1-O-acyltransferase [Myxococcota bacterium]|jgi:glycerol-3-phosphate O-acyltransferase